MRLLNELKQSITSLTFHVTIEVIMSIVMKNSILVNLFHGFLMLLNLLLNASNYAHFMLCATTFSSAISSNMKHFHYLYDNQLQIDY